MARSKLKPELLESLIKITGLEKKSVVDKVSRKINETGLTHNAAAHLIATNNEKSFWGKLDDEDKASWRHYQLVSRPSPMAAFRPSKKGKASNEENLFKPFKNYKPLEYFAGEYIGEVSRAYRSKCYTSVFILTRKIIENLIIDIIEARFPGRDDLVYNSKKTRTLDFSTILINLERESVSFSLNGKDAIERLIKLVEPFKEDANAKAHRWFEIVKSPAEIDKWQLETIIELIKILETEVGIRKT